MALAIEVHPYDILGSWGTVQERTLQAGHQQITFRTSKGTVTVGANDTVVASLQHKFNPPKPELPIRSWEGAPYYGLWG